MSDAGPPDFTRDLVRWSEALAAIARTGLGFTKSLYEQERFEEVLHVAADVYPENIDVGVQQNAEGTGLLFHHFQNAKAWIYVSTTGVYWDHPDPWYRYKETDRLGGSTRITSRFAYGTSKFAGEAVARTMSRIHDALDAVRGKQVKQRVVLEPDFATA